MTTTEQDETTADTADEGMDDAAAPAEAAVEALVKPDGSPVTRADWDALQEALRKARKDARTARRSPTDAPSADDADAVRAEVEQAAVGKWKPLVVRSAARSAFVEAGLVLPKDGTDAAMARVVRLLDLDDLDVADDGQVDGLREQVEEIRRDFPELFATARPRPSKVDAADRPSAGVAPKSSADLLAAAINGR